MRNYNFRERRDWSESAGEEINRILRENIPSVTSIRKAESNEDLAGTDYWAVRCEPLRPISIDVKVRDQDPITLGRDDLALETWSDIEAKKIGWTRDPTKTTDYVLWYFRKTKRWILIPFPILCAIFADTWHEWLKKYKAFHQVNDSNKWRSECIFVPRRELWHEIIKRFGGGQLPATTGKIELARFMP